MKARSVVSSKSSHKKAAHFAPVRMPGLNFDSFEYEAKHREGVYGTDRAPTYQSRYASQFPKRYIKRFLEWVRGQKLTKKRRLAARGKAGVRVRLTKRTKSRSAARMYAKGAVH